MQSHVSKKKKKCCSSIQFQLSDICAYFTTRYLEAHRCCRGSGGPSSARLRLQGWRSLWGSGRAQFVLRSNRSELGARLPVCWWWFSLSLPCATCRSACSMSWKGKLSAARCYKAQKWCWTGVQVLHCFVLYELILFISCLKMNCAIQRLEMLLTVCSPKYNISIVLFLMSVENNI